MEIQSTQVCISLKSLFSRHKGIGVQFTDEPTGNLDAGSAETVAKMLSKASQKYEQTIIMVTHDRQMADYADRIITISDGQIQ